MLFDGIEEDVIVRLIDFYHKAMTLDKNTLSDLAYVFEAHHSIHHEFNVVVRRALAMLSNFYNETEEYPSQEEIINTYNELVKYQKKTK